MLTRQLSELMGTPLSAATLPKVSKPKLRFKQNMQAVWTSIRLSADYVN